jgi:hypothetical protein
MGIEMGKDEQGQCVCAGYEREEERRMVHYEFGVGKRRGGAENIVFGHSVELTTVRRTFVVNPAYTDAFISIDTTFSQCVLLFLLEFEVKELLAHGPQAVDIAKEKVSFGGILKIEKEKASAFAGRKKCSGFGLIFRQKLRKGNTGERSSGNV